MFSNWAQVAGTSDCVGRRGRGHHRPVHHLLSAPASGLEAPCRLALWGLGSASLMPESPEVRGPVVGPLEGRVGGLVGDLGQCGTPSPPRRPCSPAVLADNVLLGPNDGGADHGCTADTRLLQQPRGPRRSSPMGWWVPGLQGGPATTTCPPSCHPRKPRRGPQPALRPPPLLQVILTTPPGQTTRSSLPWGRPCEYCRFIARPSG